MKKSRSQKNQTPPRVAHRLEGVVKNIGIKPKQKNAKKNIDQTK